MKYSKDKVDYIIHQYLSGKTQVQIAKELNTYNTTIRRILLKNNIPVVGTSERWRNIDINIFDDYSNPAVQYWLGAIVADGCLTNNAIVFETIDKEWVEKFRNFMNPFLNINSILPKRGKKLYRFSTRCKGLSEKLLVYGITYRKSLTIEFLYPITWHFFRGVFDGDGCISRSNKRDDGSYDARLQIVSGSEIFIDQLYNFLKSQGFSATKSIDTKSRKNPQYSVNLFKQKELHVIYDLLYSEADINFLERKYLKFGSLLGKPKRQYTSKTGKDPHLIPC